jgi:hypothetical protein
MNKFLALLLALAGSTLADEVLLKDGLGRLSGSLRAVLPDGTVVWKVGSSSSEVRIRPGNVESLFFKEQNEGSNAPFLMELRCGDAIPADLTGLSAGEATISSPALGNIKVPRDSLASVRAASAKDKVLYGGVKGGDEWEVVGRDEDSVETGLGGIKTRGRGGVEVRSSTKLPRNFRIRATFRWDQQAIPRFVLSFADPFVEPGAKSDRYFLQFVNTGMEIKRQSSGRRMYTTVGRADVGHNAQSRREVTVEVSVTRDDGLIVLTIDGKEEGRWADPVVKSGLGGAPEADGWGFSFGNPNAISEVRDISMTDLGAGGKLVGVAGQEAKDLVINRAGEKLSGKLAGSEGLGADLCFLLESAFQTEPLRIKAKEVLLASFVGKPLEKSHGPVIVQLAGQGVLHVSTAAYDGTSWTLEHPLLGRLTAPAAAVSSMEWIRTGEDMKGKEEKKP